MARARNIKPGFFKNEELAECSPLARLLFAGLWCEADREGRLEDRPRRLKAEYLAYDECDIEDLLGQLESRGFIIRYQAGSDKFIAIPKFTKHQMPHHKEVASVIPPPVGMPAITRHAYDVSNELREAIFNRDDRSCLACGATEELSLDHIVPLAKGGDNAESNLQTLCKRCNSSKGDTTKSYVGATLAQRNGNDGESCRTDSPSLIPDSPSLIADTAPMGACRLRKRSPPVPVSEIVDLYHRCLPELPRVEKLTKTREGFIRQRWQEDLPDLDHWRNYFDFVRQSDFLMGRSKPTNGKPPFRADIEWITRPNNYAKIAEEKYHG